MIHRLLERIRHINSASGFDAYFMRVQRHAREGSPTIDDARRDYRSMSRYGSFMT